jgi:long-chain acyl-CoA synthetase
MQTKCHLSVLIHQQAKKYGDKTVLIYRDFGSLKWKNLSWNNFSKAVSQVSNAMLNLGIGVQENVGVFAQNCVQYLFTDFVAF